jgi:hypothetical protein
LGVVSATNNTMGVSKLFTGTLSTETSSATDTAVSLQSIQAMYSALANLISEPLTFDEEWFSVTNNQVKLNTTKLSTLIDEATTEAATEAVNDLRIDIHVEGLADTAVQGGLWVKTSTLSESGGESIAPLNLSKDTNIIDTVVK